MCMMRSLLPKAGSFPAGNPSPTPPPPKVPVSMYMNRLSLLIRGESSWWAPPTIWMACPGWWVDNPYCSWCLRYQCGHVCEWGCRLRWAGFCSQQVSPEPLVHAWGVKTICTGRGSECSVGYKHTKWVRPIQYTHFGWCASTQLNSTQVFHKTWMSWYDFRETLQRNDSIAQVWSPISDGALACRLDIVEHIQPVGYFWGLRVLYLLIDSWWFHYNNLHFFHIHETR